MVVHRRSELTILKLTYSPQYDPEYPRITLKRKWDSPTGFIDTVQQWMDRSLSAEKSKMPPCLKVRYYEWDILTGHADLFTIYGYRFKHVFVVLGASTIHWVFFQHTSVQRRMEGRCRVDNHFCSCCMPRQYCKLVQSVKRYIMQKCDIK